MNIVRVFKIYSIFVKQEVKCFLEYKSDLFLGLIGFFLGQGSTIVFINILFSTVPDLVGWSFWEVVFIYGFSLVPKGVDHLLFDNLWSVSSNIIRTGDFDKYLIRPINTLFYVMVERFQIDAFGEIITGVVLVCIAAYKLSLTISILYVVLGVFVMPFATLIYTGIKIITASASFWLKKSENIVYAVYMVNDFTKYPITIYNCFIKVIVSYVVPFAFASYYPAVYFLTKDNFVFNIGITIFISIFLMLIGVWIWKVGIRQYESSGS